VDLTQAMLAATEDPPPTAIDIDRLITGERRRTGRLRVVTGVAVAAARPLGVAAAPRFLARQPSGQSPGAPVTGAPQCRDAPPVATVTAGVPAGEATEACEDAVIRLDMALGDALRAVHVVQPGVTGGTVFFARDGGYTASFDLPGGGSLVVRLEPTGMRSAADSAAFADKYCGAGCHRETREGTVLLGRSATDVWSVRPDGTVVQATVTGSTLITEQQLMDLVMAPGLTLLR
jgi:hypothetical protein